MDRFITEKETESLLRQQTRLIAMPDGKRRVLTLFRLVWDSFDLVRGVGLLAESEVIALAAQHSERTGEAFEMSFERVVGYAHRKLAQ